MVNKTRDRHYRSIFKALSWRLVATTATFLIAWIITGELVFAAEIGVVDSVVKLAAYYGHERFWDNIQLGRERAPEYEI